MPEKHIEAGRTVEEEQPIAVALIYRSEIKELAEERGITMSPGELDRFCKDIAGDVFNDLTVAMIERANEFIGERLDKLDARTVA